MDNSFEPASLHEQAINAALDSNWELAIKLNKQVIKIDPQNVDALNRQAKAYMELGRANLAKKYYSEALSVDPYNPIAQKNLRIIKSFKSNWCKLTTQDPNNKQSSAGCVHTKLSPSLFLQEPGKTKIVSLLKVAEPQKLISAFCGMKVEMVIKNRKITITDLNGDYLGVLPDDINHHLLRLSKGGNKYELFVKSVRINSLSVIIKETFRSKKFKNQPSFLEYSNSSVTTDILTSFDGANSEEDEDVEEEQET
ncbi:MAG: tetratricopeptide repeat protein [Candidatus Daviesbacteria bacterium]|nr:tetratricopeptide repeat protein [Candidatus Daviesbacteria bacterium]